MIHGYHVILTNYGFWMPNDPRGSWSDFIRRWELIRFGKPNRSLDRTPLADLPQEEILLRNQMIAALMYPQVILDDDQVLVAGQGIGDHVIRNRYTLWACSIMPQHTHLVLGRHTFKAEIMANQLKGAMTRALIRAKQHPLAGYANEKGKIPPMWASGQWKVYLDSELAIEQAIAYVEQNPIKEGRQAQRWSFVLPFEGIDSKTCTTYF